MGSNSMVKLMCREEDASLKIDIDQLSPPIHISFLEHFAPGNKVSILQSALDKQS